MDYYILSEDHQAIVLCKRDIVTPEVIVTNPSREQNAEYGRYPYVRVTAPAAEDGKIVKQDGYELVDTDEGKVISEHWRQLIIVDPYASVPDGLVLLHDEWSVNGDTYVHTGILKNKVDNPPEIADNQRLDDLGWEETDTDYVHNYHVVTIVDEQPTEAAESGYHWEKVGETWDDADTLRYEYGQVADPPKPVLTISKMYFEIEVAKRGLSDELDMLIDSLRIPVDEDGHMISVRRLYDQAVEFKTDNAYFQQLFSQACQSLGISEDDGWAVLLASQPR